MFTRFKVLSIAFIFVISSVLLTVFFSDDGVLANKYTQRKIISLTQEVREKESDVTALRYKAAQASSKNNVEGEVIHSFSDDSIYDPQSEKPSTEESEEYEGLSSSLILLYSLLITLLWSVIIVLVIPLLKGRRKEERKNGSSTQS